MGLDRCDVSTTSILKIFRFDLFHPKMGLVILGCVGIEKEKEERQPRFNRQSLKKEIMPRQLNNNFCSDTRGKHFVISKKKWQEVVAIIHLNYTTWPCKMFKYIYHYIFVEILHIQNKLLPYRTTLEVCNYALNNRQMGKAIWFSKEMENWKMEG